MSGIMSVTGLPGQGPVRVGVAVTDIMAGAFLAQGILIALLDREVSGEGRWVQTSLIEAGITLLDFQATRWTMDGKIPPQECNNHPTNTPMGCFATADGFINIAATSNKNFRIFCQLIGRESMAVDPRFASIATRRQNKEAMNELIAEALGAKTTLRTVRLRGISINGADGNTKFSPKGIHIVSAAVVSIEDCVVSDVQQQGILDERTGGQTRLYITDSIIRNNGGPGIVAAAAATGIVALDNVRSENNLYGIAVATGNNVSISRSVFTGNSSAGVEGDAGAQVVVDNSTITHNNIGVQSASSVRMSNNNIAFNNTAISGVSGTFGNNRFSGNGTIGTGPTPLGGASSDLGQQ
jgi:CoA-transferase family III/Right handed beta helix region